MLTAEQLRQAVDADEIDTVLVVFTDMQGRLQGKREHARFFVDEVLDGVTEGCNYLLAVDVEMNTVDGYAMSSWERGYGDFVFRPDLTTLRLVPWLPGTAMVQCDLEWMDGTPVLASPRQILRAQTERAAGQGWTVLAGTELEFIVFQDSYEQAWRKGYRDLVPANQYNVDYSILGTSRIEPLLRDIRNGMYGAGLVVESAKGECNLGQHEIAFKYADAVRTADNHSVYKTGAKEIAAQHGCSLTFMAKFNEREGSSCHVHMSLRGLDGSIVFDAGHAEQGHDAPGYATYVGAKPTPLFEHFTAGVLATLREFTLLYAPTINSYKRFQPGSFAPTVVAWGRDNRTCAIRVVGHGPGLRLENRLPGADVNPYLVLAGMVAGGLHGIEKALPLEPEETGNAYRSGKPHVPTTLREAMELFDASTLARQAFGDEVVDHYVNNARVELAAYDAAVTDWERVRGFERL
jgi:glutamine synthetase